MPKWKVTLERTDGLLLQIGTDLPLVQPNCDAGFVAFSWTHEYPRKELEIWLYDRLDYYCEWMLSVGDKDEENTARSLADLLEVIKKYTEI